MLPAGYPRGAGSLAHRAAQFLGAAEALRETIGSRMAPPERVEYDQQLALLGELLEEQARALAWQQGRVLKMAQAIELALSLERRASR